MEPTPTPARTWAAVALCAAAYLYAFPYQPTINNPNENVRHYMTAAIVEHGTYEISALRERWGWVNDAAVYEGRVYSVKAPGTSLLGVPAYALHYFSARLFDFEPDRATSLWLCRVTASILPALVFLFFLHRFLGRSCAHPALRDAVFFSVALGSLYYGYALLFVSHTTSAAVAFGAFMLLSDARRSGTATRRQAVLAGLLTASVTAFEYPGFVVSLALSVFAVAALRSPRRLAHFALGALAPTLLVMHFQWSAFGSPLRPGHLYVESDAFREAHLEGLYGATGFHLDAAVRLLFDPGSGLFPLTPLLAFALVGFPLLLARRRTRPEALCALACVGLTYLLICTMNNWRGGWTIGPRYLAVAVPFVAWAALAGVQALAERARRATAIVAIGATATAFVASGIPSAYYPHVPPEISHPLPQLFGVLLGHDFAPTNAGNLLGWTGTPSMMPWFALLFGALLLCAWQPRFATRDRLSILVGALLVGGLLLGPLLQSPDLNDRAAHGSVAFIVGAWTPAGEDSAARLERSLAAQAAGGALPDLEGYERLARLYEREGRFAEARRARARGAAASRSGAASTPGRAPR